MTVERQQVIYCPLSSSDGKKIAYFKTITGTHFNVLHPLYHFKFAIYHQTTEIILYRQEIKSTARKNRHQVNNVPHTKTG